MPSSLASIIYLSIVVFLFRRELRQKPNVTGALWIPLIWIFINMSRFLSSWLDIIGLHLGGSSIEEGSPVDALGSLILIIAAFRVLMKRGFQFPVFVQYNRWIFIFLLYCFFAVFWSDFVFVAFKRWIKILGNPLMVMVLFTEPDFEIALETLMKRLAYVIVPVSFLFIKYYPELGRGFSNWTGQGFNTGITLGKNDLGVDSLILGFFFVWYMLKVLRWEKSTHRRNELILCVVFLAAICWLFNKAQSSTSLVSCVVGITMLLVLGMRSLRKESVGSYILMTVVVMGIFEYVFHVSDILFDILGKDRTLTDRTLVWQDCLSISINPIIGVGFESFWMGRRQEIMNERWNWHPNEAHNGYLETYLSLGLIGLFILIVMIFSTFWKARRELLYNFHFGRYRIAFLCVILIYNWTEASFKALHPMWFVFYIIALDYPKPEESTEANPSEILTDDGSFEALPAGKIEDDDEQAAIPQWR